MVITAVAASKERHHFPADDGVGWCPWRQLPWLHRRMVIPIPITFGEDVWCPWR